MGKKGQIAWNKGKKEKVFIPWSEKERIGHMKVVKREEDSPHWKGDKVGYWALHDWIERQCGKPKFCSLCDNLDAKKYEWANRSGKYLRDIDDWIRLCTSCHHKFDNISAKSWNTRRLNGR